MKMESKNLCPFGGFKKCRQHDCALFTQLRGMHPQTGQEMDEYGCALSWLPILLIENAKETRQGAAAVESFRNEMVKTGTAQAAGVGELVRLASEARRGNAPHHVGQFAGTRVTNELLEG